MDEKEPQSQTLFPHETGHHRSARERQRRGPMFGCLRAMIRIVVFGGLLILILVFAIPWVFTTANFKDYVRKRIEATLEARLGREVWIRDVKVVRTELFEPTKVILYDMRVANLPGAATPYFATVREVEITGGVSSFRNRAIRVARVDIRDPRMNFEVFPEGARYAHNFPHWKSGPPSRYEIVHIDIGELFVTGGTFVFLDRRHDVAAEADKISSHVRVTRARNLYEGVMSSPTLRVRFQDYETFETDLRGGFRYTPGILALSSIALRGRGIEAFVSGKLDPLTEAVYNLRITSRLELARVREIFRVEKLLSGSVSLDTNLRGKQGEFALTGRWVSPQIVADTYELRDARGRLNVTGQKTIIDVERARYGGGTIGAHYTLAHYGEPYPMNVDLRYNGISVEQLFTDWGIENTGLRGAATGTLAYRWNKDKVLEGSGSGNARLSKNATAFSRAKYPIPIAGATDFALHRGVITFRGMELDTDASHVSLTGTLRIDDAFTDWRTTIRSSDFSELDRVAYNFARSAGKKDFDLLGLGGAGTVTGTVRGKLKTPAVVAHVTGSGTRFNNVLLGAADIDLRYDGVRSVLTFDRAVFTEDGARLAITGTVEFPDRGPSPRFDLAVDATNYPVDRTVAALDLDFKVGRGIGTGKLIVTGTPEAGTLAFLNMVIRRGESELRLAGDVTWRPGKGNVLFGLDVAATDFPVEDIVAFLDLGPLPVEGPLTGKLHIEGPKSALEGAGSITVRKGSIFGEPVDVASAEIAFTKGRLRATDVAVTAPAGTITGEAEFDLSTNRFSYTIQTSSVDLSRLKILESLENLLGGNVTLTSSGAGTLEQPELVVEATLNDATVSGLALPAGSPPPSLYLAIRNGELIVRGSIADIVSIEGNGTVGQGLAVNGLVRITVTDIARLLAISPSTATLPASGNLVVDLKLGGKLSPIEALVIEGTVPMLKLRVSEHEFTPRQPLRFTLRDGRVVFDSFELQRDGSAFAVTGFAEITGAKRLGIKVQGSLEAALLQLFMPDVRADGHVGLDLGIGGTLSAPAISGTADLQDAQVKLAGFPQLIDDLNGTLKFGDGRIDINSVRATVGGGEVVAGGFVTLEGLRLQRVRVSLKGTNVALRYFEGVTVQGTFDLQVSGDLEGMIVLGDVDVTRALYSRDFDLQQSLLNVILSRRGITPVVAASWQDNVNLRIHLSAPNTLAVKNNIADVTGSADLDLTGTLANPVIVGTVDLNEGGTVTFQNIDYRVARGTISFSNPYRIDPYFDVTLEGRVSGGISEVEAGPIDLTVNFTGTLDRITPTITSDPPASDITLFSLLGFGNLTRQGGATTGARPGAIGQSLLLTSLTSAIGSRILPFADSFTFDPGLLDTGSGADPKVTFEKRVSNNVRLLVVYNMTSHESREVIEWTVNRDWTLQITRDETANEYRAEARFRRRYQGRWAWGHRGRQGVFDVGSVAESLGPATTVAVAPAPRTTAVAPLTAGGGRIAQINFRSDGHFDTSTLSNYVTVKPGDPLTLRELQASIKALFATGNFRDIRIDATPPSGDVVLTFSLILNYRIGRIDLEGVGGGDKRRAQGELTIRTGDVLSLDAVNDSAAAIQDQLTKNGLLEATVDPETTFVREQNLANVVFHVTPGPLAKVATVQIQGNSAPFTQDVLIKTMRDRPGKAFRADEARQDADRMKSFMVRQDHRRANVSFVDSTYDKTTHTVALRFRAVAGPIVKVEVEGISRSAVRRQLPFRSKNQEYTEDVIERAAEDMVRSLQQRGYFYATVDPESRLEDGTWITTFQVNPGQRYRLAGVTFSGNVKVRDKQLAGVIQTSPRGGFRRLVSLLFRRPTGVTRAQLSDDRDALESHYRLQGFSAATVGAPVVSARADGTMVVDFPIVEGPQTLVAAVKVEGAEQVPSRDLPELHLKAGEPLDPQLEREDVVALQTFYADRGNTEVQITPRVVLSEDRTSANVSYVISEGPQVEVGEVIVQGNSYTASDVILRKSLLDPGDPFSYTSILEAQRNLYRLGIFQRVDIQPEQTGTTVADRNVVISVEEGKNLTVTGSLGARSVQSQDVQLRLAGGIAHRNLFGTGRYLGFEGVAAGTEEQEAFLTYREPFIGRYDVPVQLTIFQTNDGTVKERRIRQRGISIEASKVTRYTTRWSLQYQYKISKCTEGELCDQLRSIVVPGLDRSLLDIQIASITPTFFWDRRDDVFDPHRGFFTTASVEYAFPLFEAPTKFLKEFVQGAWYLPVTERSVLAISGRAGLIQPMRRDNPGTPEDESLIPLAERFTAGGDTSHRAFPLDLLGTLCNDLVGKDTYVPLEEGCRATLVDLDEKPGEFRVAPLGGNAILVANAEYRFPIFSSLGGAVFADIGNVFSNRVRFDELRYGVGGGFRYLSPVGPIRIDVGWPLNRKRWDRTFTWSISLGYAF